MSKKMQNFAKMCKKIQKCSKTQQNYAKMRRIVQKIVWKYKKLAQLENICTDGVPRVPRFFHLCQCAGFLEAQPDFSRPWWYGRFMVLPSIWPWITRLKKKILFWILYLCVCGFLFSPPSSLCNIKKSGHSFSCHLNTSKYILSRLNCLTLSSKYNYKVHCNR